MIKIIGITILMTLLMVRGPFQQEPTIVENGQKIIGEGIVKYASGGGTREISYPSGYYLSDPTWIVAPSKVNHTFYFSYERDMKEYLKLKVHVEGTIKYIKGRKYSNAHYIAGYYSIIVDSIKIID